MTSWPESLALRLPAVRRLVETRDNLLAQTKALTRERDEARAETAAARSNAAMQTLRVDAGSTATDASDYAPALYDPARIPGRLPDPNGA